MVTDFTKEVRIGNLVTDLHNVLNGYYKNNNDRKKAIKQIVKKIYDAGYFDGCGDSE